MAVRCAYLELTEPSLAQAAAEVVQQGATSLSVLPMFLGVGKHAREDLPELMQSLRQAHPQLHIDCQPAVGEHDALLDLLADIALSHTMSRE